jgi:site-specific recombinase XerD
MASVSFRTDKPKKKKKNGEVKKEVPIRVCLYVSKERRPEVNTLLEIDPVFWDKKKEKVKEKTDRVNFNLRLDDIKRDLLKLWEQNKDVSTQDLKELIQEYFKGKDWNKKQVGVVDEKKNDPTLIVFIEKHIKNYKAKVDEGDPECTLGTLNNYRSFLTRLKKYVAAMEKENLGLEPSEQVETHLDFEAITMDFYHSYVAWLYKRGHNDNMVGSQIKWLKKFMRLGIKGKKHTNLTHEEEDFERPKGETDNIYLSEEELLKIYELDLSNEPDLQRYRDAFIFNCWAGVRFGDLCKTQPEQVSQRLDGKYLRLVMGKTQEEVIIPFHPIAEAIYSFYNNKIPKIKKSEHTDYNEGLKTIVERAGIKEMEQKRNYIKKKAVVKWLPKYQMVSSHSARRSFATNCSEMGIPRLAIMAITGHKTEAIFLRYVKTKKTKYAEMTMNYFNNAPVTSKQMKEKIKSEKMKISYNKLDSEDREII